MHHNHPDQVRKVVICPDTFKGTVDASDVAQSLAKGWRQVRPTDEVSCIPMADGGEGTLAAVAAAVPQAELMHTGFVPGPLGEMVPARWVRLGDVGLVELAAVAGLGFVPHPDPVTAAQCTTEGLGQVMGHAWDAGVRSLVIALGGSASTDGGFGALRALGLRATDETGQLVGGGGAALHRIRRLDTTQLRRDTAITALTDVRAPLLGPAGAAHVFGPQKGADRATVSQLAAGLRHWADLWEQPDLPQRPGAGAAGGVAFGFAAALGATFEPGAAWVARQTGLPALVAEADVLITGEGKLDPQSTSGKVVGYLLDLPSSASRWVVAGVIDPAVAVPASTISLTELAGAHQARANAERWLVTAGAQIARQVTDESVHHRGSLR